MPRWEVGRGRITHEKAVLVKVIYVDLGFSTVTKRWVLKEFRNGI